MFIFPTVREGLTHSLHRPVSLNPAVVYKGLVFLAGRCHTSLNETSFEGSQASASEQWICRFRAYFLVPQPYESMTNQLPV